MVREKRFELLRRTALDSKSSASTNSAILAWIGDLAQGHMAVNKIVYIMPRENPWCICML